MNFHAFYDKIRAAVPKASEDEQEMLCQAIHRVWEQYYPIDPTEGDFILNLGVLLFEMKRYSDALLFFQRTLEITETPSKALTNMGACYLSLHDPEAALDCFQRAKTLEQERGEK